jgi:Divergent InlB B-repeat domain/Immunoglobulin I-set domain
MARLAFCLSILFTSSALADGFTLTLSSKGSGTFTKDPNSTTYPAGATVLVTAVPNFGWDFTSWSGDVSSTVNPLSLTMNSNLTLVGHFYAQAKYTLTVQTIGQGMIALNPPGGSYLANAAVTATATPSAGWVFDSWSGDVHSVTNPLALTMNSNLTVTGVFGQLPAFDVQPVNVTNAVGSTVTFSAHAVGSNPLTLQWFFSGGALAGATDTTLTLTNVSSAQVWYYWCTASNGYGSATSSVVSLTLTNSSDVTRMVSSPDEALLRTALAGAGKVTFDCDGTITLSQPLTITIATVIDAAGHSIILSGNNAVRVFEVNPGTQLTVQNLAVAYGRTNSGAGLYNNGGVVTLSNVLFMANQAVGTNGALASSNQPPTIGGLAAGGAIYNDGSLTLLGCRFIGNGAYGGTGAYGDYINYGASPGGLGQGGAIYSSGTLSAGDCQFLTNSAFGGTGGNTYQYSGASGGDGYGGAIYAVAAALTNCVLSGNGVRGGDGGAAGQNINSYDGNGGQGSGGAIYITTWLTTINCTFSANQTTGGGSRGIVGSPPGGALGGAVCIASGTASFSTCSLVNNNASSGLAYHRLSIERSPARGGAICNLAGVVSVDNTTISSNTVSGSAAGGGIYHGAGTLTLSSSSVVRNQALSAFSFLPGALPGLGGGLFNGATASVSNCAFTANSAVGGSGYSSDYNRSGNGGAAQGGAICNSGALDLSRCTLAGNAATAGPPGVNAVVPAAAGGIGYGGAIYNNGTLLRVSNCTVAMNYAAGGPGALGYSSYQKFPGGNSYGGGIYNDSLASSSLTYCTLSGNAAIGGAAGVNGTNSSPAGTGYGGNVAQTSSMQLVNTIVASGQPNNTYGTLSDLGNNISSDTTCAFTAAGSLNNTDPLLGPLADYGGPTQTMPLLTGSPAIDAAVPQLGIDTDQRGTPRPFGPAPDIGAYEFTGQVYNSFSATLQSPATGVFHLQGRGPTNQVFRVLVSSNLVTWTVWTISRTDREGAFELMDYAEPFAAAKFYRISSP